MINTCKVKSDPRITITSVPHTEDLEMSPPNFDIGTPVQLIDPEVGKKLEE
jgi:hypothetical protein